MTIGTLLVGFALLAAFIWLVSCVSRIGEPTKEEQEAENAQIQRTMDESAQRAANFQRLQTPLWRQSSTALTPNSVIDEIGKCKQDIERGDSSPYVWRYDDVDAKAAIASITKGRPVRLAVEHRLDMIGENSVELAEYDCWFNGAGYERVQKDPNVHYTKDYLSDD